MPRTTRQRQQRPRRQRHRFVVGETVVPGPDGRLKGADPFHRLVVIGVARNGTLTLARLGGDEGRYWDNVPASAVILDNDN